MPLSPNVQTELMEKALAPRRHPQPSLFLGDISDALIRDDMASMEHPLFALKTGDMSVRHYKNGDSVFEIRPSIKGVPSIFDKDVLLYVISKLMTLKSRGVAVQKEVVIDAKEYLEFTNRSTAGRYYELLKDSLDRLSGSQLYTSIKTGGEVEEKFFHILDSATIKRHTDTGRVYEWRVELSDWLMRIINHDEVLSINQDYFLLRKPLHRRIYEIARKHCNRKSHWAIGLDKLHLKSGSKMNKQRFRREMEALCEINVLPDYEMEFDGSNFLFGYNGEKGVQDFTDSEIANDLKLQISSQAMMQAGRLCRDCGADLTKATDQFIDYVSDREPPKNVDGAYIAFIKKWLERRNFR